MKPENITLIGMPGAGKSTMGVVLAKMLGYQFLDADLEIQRQTGRLLHELIEEHGEEGFLTIENRVNAQIQAERCVIAPGGSVVYGRAAMEHLSRISTVIYLKLSAAELQKRLGDLQQRGVVSKPGQSLEDLLEERAPLYERYADLVLEADGLGLGEAAQRIIRMLGDI